MLTTRQRPKPSPSWRRGYRPNTTPRRAFRQPQGRESGCQASRPLGGLIGSTTGDSVGTTLSSADTRK
jgi:hypothetical protein